MFGVQTEDKKNQENDLKAKVFRESQRILILKTDFFFFFSKLDKEVCYLDSHNYKLLGPKNYSYVFNIKLQFLFWNLNFMLRYPKEMIVIAGRHTSQHLYKLLG